MTQETVEHGRFVQWRPWQGGAYRLYCVVCNTPVLTDDERAWEVRGAPDELGIVDRSEPT